MYYVATSYGFLCMNLMPGDEFSTTKNIRTAKPFASFEDADKAGERFVEYLPVRNRYFAVLKS